MISRLWKGVLRRVRRARLLLEHRGSKFICPMCGYGAKDLAPMGYDLPVIAELQIAGAGRRNAMCYKCGSSDRERLIYAYLFEELTIADKPEIQSILHMAPETNLYRAIAGLEKRNYLCGDLYAEGYKYEAHVRNMNLLSLPFDSGVFDLIICNHVLEHIENDQKALGEVQRVLRPGGIAILQVPISLQLEKTLEDPAIKTAEERERNYGQFDHVRLYGMDYPERLKMAGFKVRILTFPEDYKKYGLNPDEKLFICSKEPTEHAEHEM